MEVSALEEAADGDVIVKRRNGRQATGEWKKYKMCQRNSGSIDFEAERIEVYLFGMKQCVAVVTVRKMNMQNNLI